MSYDAATPLAASPNLRLPGLAIALAAVGSIAIVALDQNASGSTAGAVLESITRIRTVHQSVHLGAILCTAALAFGHARLAGRLGLQRSTVLAGLMAYLIGCIAMFGATLLDGFITPDVAAAFVKATPESVKTGYDLVKFIGLALTDLARLGWIFQGTGAFLWSMALVKERGMGRTIGVLGLVSGTIVVAAAAASGPYMSLPAILGILAAQLLWNLAAGTYLIKQGGKPAPQA